MAKAMTALAEVTLSSTATVVTFSSIPSGYRDLVLRLTGTVAATGGHVMKFNNDSGANYNSVTAYGDGIGGNSGSYSAANASGGIGISYFWDTAVSTAQCSIFDYSQTDKYKSFSSRSGGGNYNHMFGGYWASTAAITSIALTCSGTNFAIGSTFTLYGVSA